MPARRFRWLPRFSIGNLLMLMTIVGLCLVWYDQQRKRHDQAEVIEKQRLEIFRLTVSNIVRSDMPDDEKARALTPFIKVGDRVEDVEKWYGPAFIAEMPGVTPTTIYQTEGSAGRNLVVEFVNGTVSRFGYYTGQSWVQFVSLSDRAPLSPSGANEPRSGGGM